jgi:hypothetical protein
LKRSLSMGEWTKERIRHPPPKKKSPETIANIWARACYFSGTILQVQYCNQPQSKCLLLFIFISTHT